MDKPEIVPAEIDRDKATGHFIMGKNGGPGRPKGSRTKLGEAFLEDVREMWATHGKGILEKCAQREPMATAKMISNLLPREFLVQATMDVNKTSTFAVEVRNIEEFAKAYELVAQARQFIGASPPIMIEAEQDNDDD